MLRKSNLVAILAILLVTFPALTVSASSKAMQKTTAAVNTHPSQGPVTQVNGATARLMANDVGIIAKLRTRELEIGHPHTLWVIVINHPEECEASPCTSNDILNRSDIVGSNVSYGGGRVVRSHTTPFMARVPVGEVEGGWYDTEFTNPRGAEVHLVLHDHGPMIAGLTLEMTRTLRAGCTEESVPAAYPEVAFADGTPGPNTCRLVQAAVFQQ